MHHEYIAPLTTIYIYIYIYILTTAQGENVLNKKGKMQKMSLITHAAKYSCRRTVNMLLFNCSYVNMYHNGHHAYIDSTISLCTVIL